jgi:hypothetical protein
MQLLLALALVCASTPARGAVPPAAGAAAEPRVVRLGVVTDRPAPRTVPIAERFRGEIRALLEGEFVVEEILFRAD